MDFIKPSYSKSPSLSPTLKKPPIPNPPRPQNPSDFNFPRAHTVLEPFQKPLRANFGRSGGGGTDEELER